MRNELQVYKENLEKLETKKVELQKLKEEFEFENSDLISSISELRNDLDLQKLELTDLAKEEFEQTGLKKLTGGLGVRVGKDIQYDESEAFDWAKEHSMCLQLNEKEFESIAKIQSIPFVTINEKLTITFPKKIEL